MSQRGSIYYPLLHVTICVYVLSVIDNTKISFKRRFLAIFLNPINYFKVFKEAFSLLISRTFILESNYIKLRFYFDIQILNVKSMIAIRRGNDYKIYYNLIFYFFLLRVSMLELYIFSPYY
nr:MAG TPA: hypothetical protein [Caudoviricetes sp.]